MDSGKNKIIPFHTQQRDRRRLLAFMAALVALLLIVVFFFAGGGRAWKAVRRAFIYGQEGFTIRRPAAYAAAMLESSLVTVGDESITVYDSKGDTAFVAAAEMTAPELQTASGNVLVWDAGGTKLVLLNKKGNVLLDPQEATPIYDADLSEGGFMAVLRGGSREKAVLQVIDPQQKSSFTLHSDTRYLSRCAVSPKGNYVCAVSLGQNDTGFCAFALVYDTGKEEPVAEVPLGNQLIYDLKFLDKSTICLVGEKSVTTIKTDGRLLGSYEYEELSGYTLEGDGFCALSVSQNGAETLVTLDKKCQVLAAADTRECQVEACGQYVLWSSGGEVILSDSRLRNRFIQESTGRADTICLGELGQVYVLDNSGATLYLP